MTSGISTRWIYLSNEKLQETRVAPLFSTKRDVKKASLFFYAIFDLPK